MAGQPGTGATATVGGIDYAGAIREVHDGRGAGQPSGKLASPRRFQGVQPEIGERHNIRDRSAQGAFSSGGGLSTWLKIRPGRITL